MTTPRLREWAYAGIFFNMTRRRGVDHGRYGMLAYAKDGKAVCFFQDARKFKTMYATLSFNDAANSTTARCGPIAFALKELTAAEEARIGALVKKR